MVPEKGPKTVVVCVVVKLRGVGAIGTKTAKERMKPVGSNYSSNTSSPGDIHSVIQCVKFLKITLLSNRQKTKRRFQHTTLTHTVGLIKHDMNRTVDRRWVHFIRLILSFLSVLTSVFYHAISITFTRPK